MVLAALRGVDREPALARSSRLGAGDLAETQERGDRVSSTWEHNRWIGTVATVYSKGEEAILHVMGWEGWGSKVVQGGVPNAPVGLQAKQVNDEVHPPNEAGEARPIPDPSGLRPFSVRPAVRGTVGSRPLG